MSRSTLGCVTTALLLASCSVDRVQDPIPGRPVGVPPQYAFLYDGGIDHEEVPHRWRDLPYESITLERQGCFGTCPVYTATLRKGGEADYKGEAFVDHQGHWAGEIDIWDYARLCYLIDELRFSELATRYAAPWTDSETVVITVVPSKGGPALAVSEYGGYGPPELWALQLAIDAAAARVKWTKRE